MIKNDSVRWYLRKQQEYNASQQKWGEGDLTENNSRSGKWWPGNLNLF